jgi:hypothetical protein
MGDWRGLEQKLLLYQEQLGEAASRRAQAPDDLDDVICRTRAGQVARSIARDGVGLKHTGAPAALGTIGTLCATTGVCRATAVQALRILEAAGMLTVRPGRAQGYFLKEIKPEAVVGQLTNVLQARPGAPGAAGELLSFIDEAWDDFGRDGNIVIETLISALDLAAKSRDWRGSGERP